MMLPYQGNAQILPASAAYSYVYQPIEGVAYPADVSFVPVMPSNLLGKASKLKVNAKLKNAANAFEVIAKRNGIKVSTESETVDAAGDAFEMVASRNGIKISTDKENRKECNAIEKSPADYFEILARRNGIKVSSSDEVQNEYNEQVDDCFLPVTGLSPTAKEFVARTNMLETVNREAINNDSTNDFRTLDLPSALPAFIQERGNVKNTEIIKMFEVILKEKREFERKQFQVLQDYIEEQKNRQKEIHSLNSNKVKLEEKVKDLTDKLKILSHDKSELESLKERNLMLSSEVAVMTDKLIEVGQTNLRLQCQVETLSRKLEEKGTKNEKLESLVEEQSRDLEGRRIQDEILETSLDKLTEMCRSLEEDRDRLKFQMEEQRCKLDERKLNKDILENSLERLTQKCTCLLEENDRLSKENEIMQEKLRTYDEISKRNSHTNEAVKPIALRQSERILGCKPEYPSMKCSLNSMDSLDAITVDDYNDDDELWTVVSRTKKVKATKTLSFSPPEKCRSLAGRKRRTGSSSDICFDVCSRPLSTFWQVNGVEAVPFKPVLSDKQEVVQPSLQKPDNVNINDVGTVDKSCDVEQPKPAISSDCGNISREESVDQTTMAGEGNNGALNANDKDLSINHRDCSTDGGIKMNDPAKAVGKNVMVSSGTEDKPATVKDALPSADFTSSNTNPSMNTDTCTSTAGVTSNGEVKQDPSVASMMTDHINNNFTGTGIGCGDFPFELANLDMLAKELGFGDNWHQHIIASVGLGVVNPVNISGPVVSSNSNAVSAGPSSEFTCRQPERWVRSNATKTPVSTGNNLTDRVDGGSTVSCGENTQKRAPSSFEYLMDRLTERFPSKTRTELVAFLKKAKTSFGQLGFRKKKVEEIVQRVGELILQESGKNESNKEDVTDKICCICHESLTVNEKLLECKHSFHQECIEEWISKERTCPLCRSYALTQEDFPSLG